MKREDNMNKKYNKCKNQICCDDTIGENCNIDIEKTNKMYESCEKNGF